jgi:tetratricopeptide (TPR) repeat protein
MPMPNDKNNPENPGSPKLKPATSETGGTGFPKIPSAGVSPKLKVFVIGLTFLTIMAFGVFIAMFVKKAFVKGPKDEKNSQKETWGPQLLPIAKELENQGLHPQAIEQYKKYLDAQDIDMETRSRVSFDIATLYVKLGQCDDAVAWFLLAKTAQPTATWVQNSESHLQQCRSRAKISP